MRIVDRTIEVSSATQVFKLFPIGDVHIGKINCDEGAIRKLVREIAADENAFWIGGGDLIDAIKIQDIKRFDPGTIADWVLEGRPEDVREALSNMTQREAQRLISIMGGAANQCLGLVSGNHEDSVRKYNGHDVHNEMVEGIREQCTIRTRRPWVEDLTDEAFIRLKFVNREQHMTSSVILYITHGFGGGRSAGAEKNKLAQMVQDKDAHIMLRGHTHKFDFLHTVRQHVPEHRRVRGNRVPRKEIYAFNWGSWIRSDTIKPATYETRSQYQVIPHLFLELAIKPFHHSDHDGAHEVRVEWRSRSF